jgi:hypothetical protein
VEEWGESEAEEWEEWEDWEAEGWEEWAEWEAEGWEEWAEWEEWGEWEVEGLDADRWEGEVECIILQALPLLLLEDNMVSTNLP